jgi:hypothetical protein
VKTNETEYAESLASYNSIITTYQTKVNDYLSKNRDDPDISEYNALIEKQA